MSATQPKNHPREMIEATEEIQNLARIVVASLGELVEVKGILCFGSYATGTFDEHSDVDLFVFCDPEVLPESARRDIFERLPTVSDLELSYSSSGWDSEWCPHQDRFRLDETLFDLSYNTVNWLRTVVRKVTENGETSIPELRFRAYAMLGLLERSMILYDPGSFLGDLVKQLYPYPAKLKEN